MVPCFLGRGWFVVGDSPATHHQKPYKTIQSQQRCLMIFLCAEAFSIKKYLLKSLSGVLGAAGAAYPCPTPWSAHGSNWWTYPRFSWSKRDLTPESFSRAFRCFGGSKAHEFHDLPRVPTGVHRVSPSFSNGVFAQCASFPGDIFHILGDPGRNIPEE